MRPLSQHHARRLLELVSDNKTSPNEKEHVDHDVWARTHPPVRGLNFRDRETATYCLKAGGLGAVPSNPPQLPDAESRALPPAFSNHQNMAHVESNQSKFTVSSAPSFGKMRDSLTGDSANFDQPPAKPTPVTEYEELRNDALITQVQDELDDEFEDTSPSRLFSEIGPSVSIAKGIDGKKRIHVSQEAPQYSELLHDNQFPEPISHIREDTESEDISVSSAPKSILSSQPKTFSSLPSTTTSLPPPPPPLPSYALEQNKFSENNTINTQLQPNALPVPPPPPLLHTIQSYGSTPAVPPPPSSPPPKIEEKRMRRDTDDSSPVTEGESYDYGGDIRDEFSDLADSSVPSMRGHWDREFGPIATTLEKDAELEEGLGVRPVESEEEQEYEQQGTNLMVDRNLVGRRSEPLLG